MKLQYLGDSKDSFKWDYHDFLADTLKVPSLDVFFMMTPDDGGDDGKTHPSLFPARQAILDFCHEVRSSRSIEKVKLLPHFTNAKYQVNIHRKEQHFTHQNRREYFGAIPCNAGKLLFLDPDNGFEPEKSCGEKHISYKDIHNLLCQLPHEAVISVFHHFRRITFANDFMRISERLCDCYVTAIYWHSLMFIAVSKSEEAIARVTEANRCYSESYPVKAILYANKPAVDSLREKHLKPPYYIKCRDGGERVGVLAYHHKEGGVCFLDVGWYLTSCNPFHILSGPFVAKATPEGLLYEAENGDFIRQLTENDRLWSGWQIWQDYLNSPDGARATEEEAVQGCLVNGALIDKPL